MPEVLSNAGTEYRVRIGFDRTYNELHLDVVGLAELDTAVLGPAPATYTYANVTADVIAVDISRGRSRTTDTARAGSCALRLFDLDRDYDPENTSGPYYGDIAKGRPVIVDFRKTHNHWHELFTGTIEQIAYRMEHGGYQVAEFVATDALAELARQALQTDTAYSAELSGARVSAILTSATLTNGTSIATGTQNVVARTEPEGAVILDLLNNVAAAEGGELFASAAGTLTFTQRYANANPVSTYSLTPDLTSVRYSAIDLETAAEVYPQVQVTDSTGTLQVARNDLTYVDYTGILTIDAGELLDAAGANALAQYELAAYGTPATNVHTVEVPVIQEIAAHVHDLLSTDLGDAVQVVRTFTVGTPTTLTEWYSVEAIDHRIDRGRHNLIFTLGAKQSTGWLQLDSTAFGTLNQNRLG